MATADDDGESVRDRLAHLVYAATVLGSVLWLGAVVLAPWLRSRGHVAAASFIYSIFAPVCHQIPARSFHWAGFPMAVCGRCLGIYAGFLAGLIANPWVERFSPRRDVGSRPHRYRLPRPLVFLAFSLPIALDFAAGLIGLWDSTNTVRFATGALWGGLLPFYFLPGVLGLFARRAERGPRPAEAGLDNRGAKP